MQAVDLRGEFNEIFFDPERKIPKAHLERVCKKGEGQETCRYIGLGPEGFVCVKNTKLARFLDERVANDQLKAQGDNCNGLGEPIRREDGKET